jgi:DNA-binding NtrC family response regulator
VRTRIEASDVIHIGKVMVWFEDAANDTRARPVEYKSGPPVLVEPTMKQAYELATKAAGSDLAVLILGETGVGKEVLAETIHQRSPRAEGPFLRLNCGALSPTLIESELFGHDKAAFTGAVQAREGLLEAADGGTLFLDEVGDLPLTMQVKLLRVLEDGMVLRVGGTKPKKTDIRIVAATNRDLKQGTAQGTFREDLYFRLAGVRVRLPPLRERKSEIEPLTRYFLNEFCRKNALPLLELTAEALSHLHNYFWPGNVRELKNCIERAALVAGMGPIEPRHLEDDVAADSASADESTNVLSHEQLGQVITERDRIIQALDQCAGNQTRAARLLGISRQTLSSRLDAFNIPRPRKGT